MGNSGFYDKNKTLREGEYYIFKYLNCITMEDNNKYMVFEDEFGTKYFIEFEPYQHYSLKLLSEIRCFVDKINCTGRVFLEPEHPIYQAGESYYFTIKSIFSNEDGLVLSVVDCFDNLINLQTNGKYFSNNDQGGRILAKITRIKKGVPELTLEN